MIAALMDNTCTDPQYMGVGADHRRGYGWRFGQIAAEMARVPDIGKRIGYVLCHLPDGLDFERNPDGTWATDNGQFKQLPYALDACVRAEQIPELDHICNHDEFAGAAAGFHHATGCGIGLYYGAGEHSAEMVARYALSNRSLWRSRVTTVLRRAKTLNALGVPVTVFYDTGGGREALSQCDAFSRIVRAAGIGFGVEPYGLFPWNKGMCSVTMENFGDGKGGPLPNPRTLAQPAMLIPTSVPLGPARVEWALKREAEGWVPLIGVWNGSLSAAGVGT